MLQKEPRSNVYLKDSNSRYFVPDLSPQARDELKRVPIRFVFVGESPHISEVEPETLMQRRPLCGAAGKQWWSLLSEILEGEPNPDVSLKRQLKLCSKYQFAVINAVQYPLDPKVTASFQEADPIKNLGFGKLTGEYSFKKYKSNPRIVKAIQSLRERLSHPSVQNAKVFSLGNDSEWFLTQAFGVEKDLSRMGVKIPHPSAWWRKGGFFGRDAREKLVRIFDQA
jgi:hypothetical protein